jgi:hypothetical protein
MSPILLDALTIFFIVAGLALLCANLRAWRPRTVPAAPPKRADNIGESKPPAPSELEPSAPERLTLMSDAELEKSSCDHTDDPVRRSGRTRRGYLTSGYVGLSAGFYHWITYPIDSLHWPVLGAIVGGLTSLSLHLWLPDKAR